MPKPHHSILLVTVIAIAMTYLFWWPLYGGAGFIGGDLYPYFFPQKAFYADCLKSGRFPLWNDLSGFGYPVLGESQTGAAYPFHFILYQFCELNTAYNIEHLLHYVICFAATWLFAKRLGLTVVGAGLVALVFTYGWFPPRACLEWAILTGAWMPVALWCVESFLQTRLWRYAIGLSVTIGIQLLGGHYHLAFITELTVVAYATYRLWIKRGLQPGQVAGDQSQPCRKKAALGLVFAVIAGGGLASIQVLPTWELKQRSTRIITGGEYDPAYGQMPPMYVTQLIAPWLWYSPLANDEDNLVRDLAEFAAPWHWFGPIHEPGDANKPYDLDREIHQCRFATTSTGTNKIEAHVYCGLVPVGLALFAMIRWFRIRRRDENRSVQENLFQQTIGFWLIAGLFAIIYASGLLLPIGRNLPGFSFFRGPGRYGIVTTLAIALLSGQALDQLLPRITSKGMRTFIAILIFSSTCGDLWLVSRMVKYTVMVSPPRISFREASVVRTLLRSEPMMPRLLAPGPNVGNLLGVSCVPWYLGMAPTEYVDPQFAMPKIPKPLSSKEPTQGTPELIEWLSRSGVTHVLNFEPLEETSWQVELIWKGIDPFLNRVWAREEPIHLYRFLATQSDKESNRFPGRAYLTGGDGRVMPSDWQNAESDFRRVVVESDHNEKSTLVLSELAFPGWTAEMNSVPIESRKVGMFRAVDLPEGKGEVTWTYHPTSVYFGAAISLGTLFLLAAISHLRFWHPKFVDRVLNKVFGQ